MRVFRWPVLLGLVSLASCLSTPAKNPYRLPAGVNHPGVYDDFSARGFYELVEARKMQPGAQIPRDLLTRQLAGREIWFKSAPNSRFHSYIFSGRANAPIDWYGVLRSDRRWQRFNIWGTINDPDCCTPGEDCERRGMRFGGRDVTLADTYGFDFCPGDETLLGYIGRADLNYGDVDPACTNAAVKAADRLQNDPVETACELAFGTSTGTVGLRKFPNPKFNPRRWEKFGGWDGWQRREFDASIEPPFRVGMACAMCHAAFDPLRPPKDVNHPEWFNISGTIGNQFARVSQILGSGTKRSSLEWQVFIPMSRAGTTDTSAVPNDMVINPGTMNSIINLDKRPVFNEWVSRWRHVASCDPSRESCQAVEYRTNGAVQKKYWEYSRRREPVPHLIKGGEDSVGADLAIERVYVNIGLCAEQCWVNHHTDTRALSPHDRGFLQTPFDIGQCRRDCASWRANEDRVGNIRDFLFSGRPFDLKDALANEGRLNARSPEEANARFIEFVEARFSTAAAKASVSRGRELFAENCARCHSSQNRVKADDYRPAADDFSRADFSREETSPIGEIVRADFMGNDKSIPAREVGTYKCRSLHRNHRAGRLWSMFANDDYSKRPPQEIDARGQAVAGGPGYYRNISLLSVWATAPFMHNNAVGPEICGRPQGLEDVHYNTYAGEQTDPRTMHKCDVQADPSVESRLRVFDLAMDEMLTPSARRTPKLSVAAENVRIPLGMNLKSLGTESASKFYLEFPARTPIAKIGSLDYKALAADILGSIPLLDKPAEYAKYWNERGGERCGEKMAAAVRGTLALIESAFDNAPAVQDQLHGMILEGGSERLKTYQECYSTCDAGYENMGHDFMVNASAADKNSLKAFLSTL